MPSQRKRNPYFDNAKFLLMFLVVFGHFLQPFIGNAVFYADLYYFIFLFHMPAFILIAGYFSKSFVKKGSIIGLVRRLLLPYVAFQLVYSGFYTLIGLQSGFRWDLMIPQWSLWFLISLFCWQFSLFFFQQIRPLWGITLSVAISLAAGYLPFIGREWTLQRTLTFLPFFVIGFYLKKEMFDQFTTSRLKYWAVGLLPLLYAFVHFNGIMNKYWLFGSKPYEDFLAFPELGGAVRFLMIVLGLIGIVGFFGLVPKTEMFFTKWGKNTMVVYLMQGFFVKGVRALSIDQLDLTILGFGLLFAGSLVLTILLASEPIRKWKARFFWALQNKVLKYLFPQAG